MRVVVHLGRSTWDVGEAGLGGHSLLLHEVHNSEDHNPHDVDEVPVQADDLDDLGRSLGSLSRSESTTNEISMTMPTVTCTPWNPVSV